MPDLALYGVVVEKKRMGVPGVSHSIQFPVAFSSPRLLSECAAAISIHESHSSVNTVEEHRTRFLMGAVLEVRF